METDTHQREDSEFHSSSIIDVEKEAEISETSRSEPPLDDAAKPAEAVAAQYEYISGVKLFLVIASVTLACFLMMLDMTIVVTAIPRITSDFHSLPDVGWYGSVYLIASCGLQPLTGKIYSQLGSKKIFLAFLGIFELGSLLCGAAKNSKMLIVGRAVAGIGSSGLVNGALTIIGAAVPMQKRPAMMGIMMSLGQIAMAIGPVLGGALTQYASWRWCFYINLPIGALATIFLVLIKIPDRLTAKHEESGGPTFLVFLSKLDLIGFSIFAPFAAMILLALEWGGTTHPWNSPIIIGLFCGGGGTLILFAAWEYHAGDEAMIPFSMLKKTVVWSSCLVIFFFFGSLLIFSYYLPIYFQAVKGVSPTLSGVYILPGILSQMLMAVVSGILVGKLGYYLPWSITSAVLVAISSGLISTFTPDTSVGKWVGYQFLGGFGRGCGFQMPIVAIQNILPPAQIPVGMALVVFSQTFGGALFLTFGQTIFSQDLVRGLAEFAPTANAAKVVAAGATAIRDVVTPEQLPGVLKAYSKAIDHDFYLAAGTAVASFAFCWGMGWKNIKKTKEEALTGSQAAVVSAVPEASQATEASRAPEVKEV